MIYTTDESTEISGDWTYECPFCNSKTDVTTTGDMPGTDDEFRCRVCNKKLIVLNREVKVWLKGNS